MENLNKKASAEAPTQRQVEYSTGELIAQRLYQGSASRKELQALTGIGDRATRDFIKLMRNAGYPIINMSDNKGYKFAESQQELERYKRQEFARANSIIRTANAMHLMPAEQISMFF